MKKQKAETITKRSAEAVRKSEEQLRLFLTASSDMLYKMSADWKEMYVLNGRDILADTDDPAGDWTEKYIPEADRALVWQTIQQAIDSGTIFELEHRVFRADGSVGWVRSRAVPVPDENGKILEWVGAGSDITERKQTEIERQRLEELEKEVTLRTSELNENRALLKATLDSTPEMIQVFKAVRDENEKIIDFIWILINHTSEQLYGDVIGKRLLENNPGVLNEGIFKSFVDVVETGIPQQYEKHYVHEQFDGWYYQSVVKLNDGVATTTLNITERKRAELQLKESRDQLRSILDTTLVQMSILEAVRNEHGLITDLVIKNVNQELEKETGRKDLVGKLYTQEYPGIVAAGLFDLIVKAIETGEPQATEYFYPHEDFSKWYSCMFVKLDDGVVATNMDITARKQAEEERLVAEASMRKMATEQQGEIFRVSLSTLEEERSRISESLHNGIGQILYGIKLSLGSLNQQADSNTFDKAKKQTLKLLSDAIIETRRMSHELMPTSLEEFGLESALNDICKQLSGGMQLACRFTGLNTRLEKNLELAVYRTVQELMTNIVKHAAATEARVAVAVGRRTINISVSDNGLGISTDKEKKPGIGLASIRSKIKLLNGEMLIDSSGGKGTTVSISIPRPDKPQA